MIYLLFLYNAVRISIHKLLHKNFKASLLQRISPSVELKLIENGGIVLGRNVCISRNSSLVATNSGSISIGDRVFMNLRVIN